MKSASLARAANAPSWPSRRRELADELAVGLEAATRLLLRAEGLASSFIEGVEASAEEVTVAELDLETGGAAAWVADNLAAVEDALAARGPLTEELLLDCGAAITHAQFETIHPFADGNGRIGRVVIARMLEQRLAITVPPLVSAQFARDIGGYLSGLTLWRDDQIDYGSHGSPAALSRRAARRPTRCRPSKTSVAHGTSVSRTSGPTRPRAAWSPGSSSTPCSTSRPQRPYSTSPTKPHAAQ